MMYGIVATGLGVVLLLLIAGSVFWVFKRLLGNRATEADKTDESPGEASSRFDSTPAEAEHAQEPNGDGQLARLRTRLSAGCPGCKAATGITEDTPLEKVKSAMPKKCFYCGYDFTSLT